MYMIIGYGLLCFVMSTYAANNDETEQRYFRVKLRLAYAGQWGDLWDISQEYKEHHLLEASKVWNWDKVKAIVAKHHNTISLDVIDAKGNFPLWCAVQAQRHDILQLLLDHGANPNQTFKSEHHDIATLRNSGSTALFQAAYLSDIQAALVLLDHGAKPDVRNFMGSTPLLAAVHTNCIAMVQLLLRRAANPNAQEKMLHVLDRDSVYDIGGDTPLIVAATKNDLEIVQLLLAAGANNIEAKNIFGKTAPSQAELHHNNDMLGLFNRAKCQKYKEPECKTVSCVQPNMWID